MEEQYYVVLQHLVKDVREVKGFLGSFSVFIKDQMIRKKPAF